jgi:hypothetical protein
MIEEARKELMPLIEDFRKRMREKGYPDSAIEKVLDMAEWDLQRRSVAIRDPEIRKKFEVEYFKDFLHRYERWVEGFVKALAE